ncbi:MAG: lipoyl(octanoyl) transferase LipB [Ignavibacteriales bacterium]
MRELEFYDLGLINYDKAWELQRETFELRKNNDIPDRLYLLEHPHTYTLGKVADKNNLISSEQYLKENQISVYEIDRGGDITYHGPGQVVGYPIINLSDWKQDAHQYLRGLEEVIIRTCRDYGLETTRIEKLTGVWIEDRKIAAIGIKVSRWITMHGFAFNVNTDLSLFNGIIPCGITDKKVTSLARELGGEMDINGVKEKLVENFKTVFGYAIIKRK